MTDLLAVWLDDRLPGVDSAELARCGVSFRAAQKVGGVRHGKRGWLLPVYIDPPSICRVVDDPVLLDLVAFEPANPSGYRTLFGVGTMLGEAAFEEARRDFLSLPVFRNPLSWLQAAGAGVVILDPAPFGQAMLGCGITLIAEDLEHGEEIERVIRAADRIVRPTVRVAA